MTIILLSSNTNLSFIVYLILFVPLCFGSNNITLNTRLYWNQTLVSTNGIFELGFFQPGDSSKHYVGMWYKQVPVIDRVILWVANRENPITDKYSTSLQILNGNLVLITDEWKTPIWSTKLDSSTVTEYLEAMLLDSGNFVLRRRSNSRIDPLWQSSDNPTHAWLPGYKLGMDKKSGTSKVLTSWKNSEDPNFGLFSYKLVFDETLEFVLLWNGTEKYWNSGEWVPEDQTFANLREFWRPRQMPNSSVIYNKSEKYFVYHMNISYLQTFVLDVSGQLRVSSWRDNSHEWVLHCSLPVKQCDVYHFCGSFSACDEKSLPYCDCLSGFQPRLVRDWSLKDYSSGCSRRTPLECKNDRFLENSNMGLPDHPLFVNTKSKEDCQQTCLSNCSCSAYVYDSDGCLIWVGDLFNIKQLFDGHTDSKILHVRVNALEIRSPNDKNRLVVIGMGSILGLLALISFVFCITRWRKRKFWNERMIKDGSLIQFRYKQLKSATKNFSKRIGNGSFGSVYEGILTDSSLIAVKMLQGESQGEKQFQAEVSIIGKVKHVNVVHLRGFCSQGSKRLLVYEYMSNGSLNTQLFPTKDGKFLGWKTRYQIAVGIAKGLAYLHENCEDCIIHCDIKPENILLDADFSPKVADFGLAKLMDREFSRVVTTMRGTRGYLAPELISGEALTTKADVYSYGMMLFELISGRRNTEDVNDEEFDFFPMRAIRKVIDEEEDVLSIVDLRLKGYADKEQVTRLCKLAGWCIQEEDIIRPTMRQVIQVLDGVSKVNTPPVPSFFQVFADSPESCYDLSEVSGH